MQSKETSKLIVGGGGGGAAPTEYPPSIFKVARIVVVVVVVSRTDGFEGKNQTPRALTHTLTCIFFCTLTHVPR